MKAKLFSPHTPVVLYGTTPPRASSSVADMELAASKLHERLRAVDIDGLVVYDVQDESSRTDEPRPFPFLPTLDSRVYTKHLRELMGHSVVTYKCVAQLDEHQWHQWLDDAAQQYEIDFLTLVGAPSASDSKRGLSLPQAMQVAAQHRANFILGGVCIAERHSPERSEAQRIMRKAQNGCEFFISQAVYSAGPTIAMLHDYARECQQQGIEPRRIILTFAPCGRAKTLEFIKWLGVKVAPETEESILTAPNPLAQSIHICGRILEQILEQDFAIPIPLGVNVESVSITKAEIDGSIELLHELSEILRR